MSLIVASCGLVPVPTSRAVPGVVREIRVFDHTTRELLTESVVGIESKRIGGGWMTGSPSHITVGDSPWPDLRFGEPVPFSSHIGERWTPQQQRRTSITRPWGIGPLGTAMHYEQQVRITARANGYRNLVLFYSPSWCKTPKEFMDRMKTSPHRELITLEDDGTLNIRLPKK